MHTCLCWNCQTKSPESSSNYCDACIDLMLSAEPEKKIKIGRNDSDVLHTWKEKDLGDAWSNLLDTFSGADGGIKFCNLMFLMRSMDGKDDPKAVFLKGMIKNLSAVIDSAQTK